MPVLSPQNGLTTIFVSLFADVVQNADPKQPGKSSSEELASTFCVHSPAVGGKIR